MENNSKQSPRMMMPQTAHAFGPLFHPLAIQQQRHHVFPPAPVFYASRRQNAVQELARGIPIQMHSPTTQAGHQTTPISVDFLSAAPAWMLANTSEFTIFEEDHDDSDDMPELIDCSKMAHEEEARSVGAHVHSSEESESYIADQQPVYIQADLDVVGSTVASRESHQPYTGNPPDSEHSSLASSESSSDDNEEDSQNSILPDEAWQVPLTISLEIERQGHETSQEDRNQSERNDLDKPSSESSSEAEEDEDPGYLADFKPNSSDTDSSDAWETEDDYDPDSDLSDDDESPVVGQGGGNHDSGYESVRTQDESEDHVATESEGMQNSTPDRDFAQRFSNLGPAELAMLEEVDASWEEMQRLLQQQQHKSTEPSTQEQQTESPSTVKGERACFDGMMAKNEETKKHQALPPPGAIKLSQLTSQTAKVLDRLDAFYTGSYVANTSKRQPKDQDCAICETDEDLPQDEEILPRRKPACHSTRAPIPCAPRRKEVNVVAELLASGTECEAELFANALSDEVGGRNNFGFLSKKRISAEERRRINDEFIEFAEGSAMF